MKNSDAYHIGELKIAQNPNDSRNVLPQHIPEGPILDVGCGAGQTLIARCPDRDSFGLDIDVSALKLGKTLTNRVTFVCGRAEALPFKDCSFNFIIARVSLPYTNIARSLSEISRVLKPGGQFWALFERISLPFRTGMFKNPKFYVFLPHLLLNTLVFHIMLKSIPFQGKYRGYQTAGALKRALGKAGFDEISLTKRQCAWEATAKRTP